MVNKIENILKDVGYVDEETEEEREKEACYFAFKSDIEGSLKRDGSCFNIESFKDKDGFLIEDWKGHEREKRLLVIPSYKKCPAVWTRYAKEFNEKLRKEREEMEEEGEIITRAQYKCLTCGTIVTANNVPPNCSCKNPDWERIEGEGETFFQEDFLIITYDKNDKVTSKRADVEKTAHYLKDNFIFKTVFGKKNDYVWNYDGRIFKQDARGIIKTKCEEILKEYAKKMIVEEIFDKIKRLTKIDLEDFETTDTNLIPLRNGVWDIKHNKLIPHSHDYNFKFIIDIEYNHDCDCPNWIKFINESLYPDDLDIVQEWFGFNLYREYFIKKGVICVGDQDTGKSVFLDTLIKFIGEKNKTGISLQKITSGSDFTKLFLKDKHSNIFDDLSSKDLSDGGAFKIATGNGYISGEEKFGEFSQFRSFAKQIFATNKIPPVKDNDDLAYFGRWIILKFDNVPEKMDPFLRKKLSTDKELSGILNWALKGLERLLKNNRFSYNKDSGEIKRIMESSGCPLVLFSNDVLENEDGHIITKDDMYKLYSWWANETKKPRLSKEQLGRQLQKYCSYILADKHKVRIWKNAKVNSEFQEKFKSLCNTHSSDTLLNNMRSIEVSNGNTLYIIKKDVSDVSNKTSGFSDDLIKKSGLDPDLVKKMEKEVKKDDKT